MEQVYPKERIQKVFKKVVKGTPVSVATREEGYAEASTKNPKSVTSTKAWNKLLEQHIPDSKLTKVLKEGLEAGRLVNDELEADYAVRHKYLETGLKLKNKFPKEPENPESSDNIKVLIMQVNNIINGISTS